MMNRTIHILSNSPHKKAAGQYIANILNSIPSSICSSDVLSKYSVMCHDRNKWSENSNLIQHFGEKTYDSANKRIDIFKSKVQIGENDLCISFVNGIYVNKSDLSRKDCVFDTCIMVVLMPTSMHIQTTNSTARVVRRYNSFGIKIDETLFKAYSESTNYDITFGKFLANKFNVDPHNWMADTRFGDIDRESQIYSCADRFLLDLYGREIKEYPLPNTTFKDITPIMHSNELLQIMFNRLHKVIENTYGTESFDCVAALDARGFYFGPHIAYHYNKEFIPIRKSQKVPATQAERFDSNIFVSQSYTTEYSKDSFGLIASPIHVGKRVLILDDLIGTGGSLLAAKDVLESADMKVIGAVTIYDVPSLRCKTYSKLAKFGLKVISIAQRNSLLQGQYVDFSSYEIDVGPLNYKIPQIMIDRICSKDYVNVEDLDVFGSLINISDSDDSDDSNDSDNSDDAKVAPVKNAKIPERRFTLSCAKWFGKSNEFVRDPVNDARIMAKVRILYTDSDKDFAHKICSAMLKKSLFQREITDSVFRYGVKINSGQFSDGETYSFIDDNIANCHVVIIKRLRTNHFNDDLQELYLTLDACDKSNVAKKTVVLPYYAYSRSDKQDRYGTPIAAAMVANFLKSFEISNVVSVDLHAAQIQGFFRKGFRNLKMRNYIAEYIYMNYLRYYPESEWNNKFVLIAPDAGSTKSIKSYSKLLGIDNIALDKTRSYKAAETGGSAVDKTRFIGDKADFKNKIGLFVDDIAATMGTMCAAVNILVENGLDSAVLFLTHGILSGPAIDRINNNPHIKEVIVSDTLPQEHNITKSPKLRIVSSAEIIGRTLESVLSGRDWTRLYSDNKSV